jgi:alanyl aminopeptidase
MLRPHVAAILAAAVAACAAPRREAPAVATGRPSGVAAAPPGEAPPALRLPSDVRPLRYAIDLAIDPAREGFSGTAAIEIALARPRSAIWLHGARLSVREASVEPAGGAPVPATFREVNDDGLARLDLGAAIGPGRATIRIAWEARWGEGQGLFLARSGGERYAASQLEAISARRVFPGFDEPAFKTPFDVSVAAPQGATVVSNGPEVSAEAAGPGTRRVRFATTPPLPTYLLFFAVGPFDVVTPPPIPPNEVRATPLPVRGIAPRGRAGELDFALRAGADLLVRQERWFGIPFPYAKLDHVAVPGFPFGGMENAGAIAYSDRALLLSASEGGEHQQRRVAGVVSHEIAHMWFGDLVTLPWWTDVWLNESFASWMGDLAVHAWRPEWRTDLRRARGPFTGGEPPAHGQHGAGTEWAMDADALESARAIRQPLERMSDVGAQFDAASYSKGAAVLGMFERYAGPGAFREGVRAYLSAHRHGTGATGELLEALSRASGRDLAGPFATFLDRPGVPLVAARASCGGGAAGVLLRQSPFVPRGGRPDPPARWRIPVCVRYAAGGAERERCALLEGEEVELAIPEGCPEWIFPNAGGAGYYRVALAAPDLRLLLDAGLPRLGALEKVALAGSLRAAQRAGALPYREAMEALVALARDADWAVAALPMQAIAHAHRDLVPAGSRPAVEAFARRLYRPALDRLGFDPRPGEPSEVRLFRAELVHFLAETGRDPEVRREAARRGAAYLGPESGSLHPEAVDPDLAADAVAAALATQGGPGFEAAVARAVSSADGAVRERLLTAIGSSGRPELVARAFALARDPRLAGPERVWALEGSFKDPATRAAALAALEADLDGLVAGLQPGVVPVVPRLAGWLCDAGAADRVEALFGRALASAPQARRAVAQSVERIRLCAAEREADGGAAARFFAEAEAPVAGGR